MPPSASSGHGSNGARLLASHEGLVIRTRSSLSSLCPPNTPKYRGTGCKVSLPSLEEWRGDKGKKDAVLHTTHRRAGCCSGRSGHSPSFSELPTFLRGFRLCTVPCCLWGAPCAQPCPDGKSVRGPRMPDTGCDPLFLYVHLVYTLSCARSVHVCIITYHSPYRLMNASSLALLHCALCHPSCIFICASFSLRKQDSSKEREQKHISEEV